MRNSAWQAGREITCDPDSATDLAEWVAEICAGYDLDAKTTARLQLVLEELFANLHDHGAVAQDATLVVALTGHDDRIGISWKDPGRAFNPLAQQDQHWLAKDVGDRPVGGLGLHLVHSLVDNIRYHRTEGRNCLEMDLYL